MYYYYHGYGWYDHVVDVWDTQTAVALVLFGVMLFCVWRLWRGMRLDAFEKNLRTLRQQPRRRLAVQTAAIEPRRGLFQISLLPLMLIATGLAMLLAQAQQPDELSRPATWGVFVFVASIYGTHAWRHIRGVGPLRNFALAGALSAAAISALLWAFYMGVDQWWSVVRDTPPDRLTARVPQLLWWTAVGGAVGALLGSARAHRHSNRLRLVDEDRPAGAAEGTDEPMAAPVIVAASPVRRRLIGGFAVGCVASLLFHLSAAPQLNRVIRLKHYYYWNSHWNPVPSNRLTLTMSSVAASQTPLWSVTTAPPTPSLPPLPAAAEFRGAAGSYRVRSATSVREVRTVVVPIRNIARGELLQAGDFRESVRDIDVSLGMLEKASEVTGAVATRDLVQGQPITNASLAKLTTIETIIDEPVPYSEDVTDFDVPNQDLIVTELAAPEPYPIVQRDLSMEGESQLNDIDIRSMASDQAAASPNSRYVSNATPPPVSSTSLPSSGPVPATTGPYARSTPMNILDPFPRDPTVPQALPTPNVSGSSPGYAGPGPIPQMDSRPQQAGMQQQASGAGLPGSGSVPAQVVTFDDPTVRGGSIASANPSGAAAINDPFEDSAGDSFGDYGDNPFENRVPPSAVTAQLRRLLPENLNPPPPGYEDPVSGAPVQAAAVGGGIQAPFNGPVTGRPVQPVPAVVPAGGGFGVSAPDASPFGRPPTASYDPSGPDPTRVANAGDSQGSAPNQVEPQRSGGLGSGGFSARMGRPNDLQLPPQSNQPAAPSSVDVPNLSGPAPGGSSDAVVGLGEQKADGDIASETTSETTGGSANGEQRPQWATNFQIDFDSNRQPFVSQTNKVGRAAGLLPGDRIVAVRKPDNMTVEQLLSSTAAAKLVLVVKQPSGAERTITVEKDQGSLLWLRTPPRIFP